MKSVCYPVCPTDSLPKKLRLSQQSQAAPTAAWW